MKQNSIKFKRMHQRGVGFIELLAYLAIFAVVFGVIISFILWTYRANSKFTAMRESQANSRSVMENLLLEIRQAKNVYTPTTNNVQLSLLTTNNPPSGEADSYIDFFLCGSQICLKREGQDPISLTSNKAEVKNLNFVLISENSAPAVEVSFDIVYPGLDSGSATTSLRSAAALRSY